MNSVKIVQVLCVSIKQVRIIFFPFSLQGFNFGKMFLLTLGTAICTSYQQNIKGFAL